MTNFAKYAPANVPGGGRRAFLAPTSRRRRTPPAGRYPTGSATASSSGLVRTGLVDDQTPVVSLTQIDVEYAYPVPTVGRDAALDMIQPWLAAARDLLARPLRQLALRDRQHGSRGEDGHRRRPARRLGGGRGALGRMSTVALRGGPRLERGGGHRGLVTRASPRARRSLRRRRGHRHRRLLDRRDRCDPRPAGARRGRELRVEHANENPATGRASNAGSSWPAATGSSRPTPTASFRPPSSGSCGSAVPRPISYWGDARRAATRRRASFSRP